jgi:hypothetical protein
MTEARVGRLLAASLHQAIGDVMPQRLDFYEEWLRSDGLRDGSIGLAPMTAVLGFLRTEEAYDRVVARAGHLAAEWTVASMSPLQRRAITLLPQSLRARVALRIAVSIVRHICSTSRASSRIRRGTAQLDVKESLFCAVRELRALPLCGFYASAATEALSSVGISARARVERCRAVNGSICVIALDLSGADAASDSAIAA